MGGPAAGTGLALFFSPGTSGVPGWTQQTHVSIKKAVRNNNHNRHKTDVGSETDRRQRERRLEEKYTAPPKLVPCLRHPGVVPRLRTRARNNPINTYTHPYILQHPAPRLLARTDPPPSASSVPLAFWRGLPSLVCVTASQHQPPAKLEHLGEIDT